MAGNGTLVPFAKSQWFTNDGEVANGYLLFTYAAGTTTKLSTYSDVGLTTPNTNPIVLDVSGRATVFLSPASFKLVLALPTDTDPPTSPVWTQDNVAAIPTTQTSLDVEGVAGENLTAGQVIYLSNGAGSLTAGRWYLASNAAYYSSAGADKLAFCTADTLTAARFTAMRIQGRVTGLVGLTTGSTYYVGSTPGSITATEPASGTPRRIVGVADSTTSLVIETPAVRGRVFYSTAVVGNVGGGEDVLYDYAAPAGELGADGSGYRIRAYVITANNANAKTLFLRVIEGANNTAMLATGLTAGSANEIVVDITILRSSSTRFGYSATLKEGPANTLTGKLAVNVDRDQTATWANAVTLRLSATGVADNDIITNGILIERLP